MLDTKRQPVCRFLYRLSFLCRGAQVSIDKPLLGSYWMNYGVLAVAGGPARAYLMSKVFVFDLGSKNVKSFKGIGCLRKEALYETVERDL